MLLPRSSSAPLVIGNGSFGLTVGDQRGGGLCFNYAKNWCKQERPPFNAVVLTVSSGLDFSLLKTNSYKLPFSKNFVFIGSASGKRPCGKFSKFNAFIG